MSSVKAARTLHELLNLEHNSVCYILGVNSCHVVSFSQAPQDNNSSTNGEIQLSQERRAIRDIQGKQSVNYTKLISNQLSGELKVSLVKPRE